MMGNQFNEIMQKLRAQRVRARRYTAMLLVLAMLTSLSVSWRLHQVGTALTTDNEYSCGMEEHVHTDDCYTEELVCGYEEGQPEDPDSAFSVDSEPTTEEPEAEPEEPEPEETEPEVHHHTADCYETVLVEHKELTCGQEEHTHDETCPVDPDTGDFLCGYEEHTHTDDCYTTETETEEKLVCGYEEGEVLSDGAAAEDGIAALEDTNTATSVADDSSSEAVSEPVLHHHTEACYEKVLTCTIPEHTHTLECLADYSADVETDDDWEKYSVGLSDNWNEALLAVAKEQLGYKESEKNFQTDEALGDIIDVHHYTRYGAFYGNPYADWDVAFIAFCQHYAGIPKTEIPQRLGLEALRADMDAMGFAYLTEGEDAAYEAIPGDVVTYNKNGTADDETIGIVETVGDDSLTVISGAVEGAVAEVTVPFTDVTSTILVDQAYSDYVGEPDDPDADGSYDDEIALQPAGETDAAAVDASEDDIFNIKGALDLNDEKNQKDLGLTFEFQKLVGNEYVKANSDDIIEEGDNVQVVVGFEAQAGTFKAGQNGNKAYYNLPYKLAEPLSNKSITDDHGNTIGRMDVNTDGLVVITFSDDVVGFDYKEHFKGTFKVWGEAFAKDDSTSGTITFPGHGNSFTLKKKSDISIHKDVDSKIIVEDGRTYFKYTIKVHSTDGTAGETVTINDNITNLWNVTGQFDKASFKLTKNGTDAEIPVGYPKIESKSDGTSNFTIEGLEALQAGENYTLTYLYEITNANTLPKDGGNVTNSATASYGNNTSNPDGTWKQIMSPELSVKKEGVYGGNNPDTVMTGRILWTITVDNPSGRDLNGFKVTDTVQTEGVIILDQNDVKGNIIQIKDGNNNEVDKIVDGVAKKGGTAKVSDDKRSFEYTFPANSTSTKYTFTYCTTVPFDALNNSAGSVPVLNEVDIDKDSEHYHGDGSANVSKREALLLKVPLGGTELEADNNRLKTVWELVIRSDASADTAKKFTIRDYFKNPTNQSNQTMDHYADKSKLEEELTAVGSKNNEKGLFFDVLVNGAYRRVYGIEAMKALGADVTIQYYTDEDSTKEADENTDKVKSFTITVDWSGRTVGTPLSVVQIHAKGYTTYVDSADSLKSGEKLSIYNYIKMGDNEKNAKSDYEKPTKKTPNLGKLVSTNEWTGFKDSADIDYTGENTLIWYKLLLKNLDANEATVEDTLPAGLEYTGTYYVGWSTAETEGRNPDKLMPFITGKSNEGAQNIQYLETPTVTGTADTGQTLVFKLKDLNNLQNPKEGSYQIAIIFSVRVTDDHWDDISESPAKKYPNEATWNKSDKIARADAFVTRKNSYVEKRNDYRDGNKEVTYTVEINKEKKTLLSTAGKSLVLHDVLTVPSKISAEIDLQSIKLYDDAKNDVTTRMKCKPDEVVDDGTNKTYKITVEVPDSAHYTLKYTYKFIVPDNVADGAQFQIKNTVDMFGNSETPSNLWYKHSGAAGSVTQDNTNTLKVYKVETDKFNNTLPGATFKLWQYTNGSWTVAQETCTTEVGGLLVFQYAKNGAVASGAVSVAAGVLYKLEETKAPDGYICDNTTHYFLMLSANQTKEEAYAAISDAKVAEANIRFVAANKTEPMYVENTAKQITIRKVWQDANGKQETNVPHEDITVKLTRADKTTGQEDTSWWADITLSSGNDWTYTYPDTSKNDDPLDDDYTYAVKEENVPTGYNVSYTDWKDGKETNTGFTSGDTVVIKNMQKSGWLKVEKKWLAEDGKTALTDLPEGTAITLKLYEVDGEANPVDTKTLKKDDGNNWKWKFTGLQEDAQYYVVEEPPVAGFKVTYSHTDLNAAPTGSTVTVTNTKKRTETTLDVVKKWEDSDGKPLTENLPDKIMLVLYEKGTPNVEKVRVEVKPDADGNWKHTFTGLEPEKEYYVEEVSVDGYEVVSGTGEGNAALPGATIVVTNRKNAPGYELPATGSTGTAPYTTAGVVLMGAALVGGYRRKRRQERRGE